MACYNPGVARVLMVSSEAAPLAKTGGLADVVGSLPPALRAFGDDVAVLIPRYGSIDLKGARRVYDRLSIYLGTNRYDASIYQTGSEYPVYLLNCPPLYDRPGFYGESGVVYPDNHIRFAVLAKAAFTVSRALFAADIFQCHDWQSELVPVYLHTGTAIRSDAAGDQDAATWKAALLTRRCQYVSRGLDESHCGPNREADIELRFVQGSTHVPAFCHPVLLLSLMSRAARKKLRVPEKVGPVLILS